MSLTWLEILLRLVVALVCGGVVGWERGKHQKSAGLRTHILVAIGSAAFVLIGIVLPLDFANTEKIELDPSRIIQGIIGGIGFLGAGTIFRDNDTVHGLTTASGIWVIAAVGVACGLGYYKIAIPIVVLTTLVNGVLVYIDPKVHEID